MSGPPFPTGFLQHPSLSAGAQMGVPRGSGGKPIPTHPIADPLPPDEMLFGPVTETQHAVWLQLCPLLFPSLKYPIGGTPTLSSPGRNPGLALRHATQSDWAKFKDTIEQLYMKDNLTLNVVMEVMKNKHKLDASTKMYKTQFARWNWSKYKSKRQHANPNSGSQKLNGKGKSAPKGQDLPLQSASPSGIFLHTNDEMKHFNTMLMATQQYLWGSIDTDQHWRMRSRFDVILSRDDRRLLPSLQPALNLMKNGDLVSGGRVLRHVFDQMATSIANPDWGVFQEICLVIPIMLQARRRTELLDSFYQFASGLATARLGSQHQLAVALRSATQLSKTTGAGEWIFVSGATCSAAAARMAKQTRRVDLYTTIMRIYSLVHPSAEEVTEINDAIDELLADGEASGPHRPSSVGITADILEQMAIEAQRHWRVVNQDVPRRLMQLQHRVRLLCAFGIRPFGLQLIPYVFSWAQYGDGTHSWLAQLSTQRMVAVVGGSIDDIIRADRVIDLISCRETPEPLHGKLPHLGYFQRLEQRYRGQEEEFLAGCGVAAKRCLRPPTGSYLASATSNDSNNDIADRRKNSWHVVSFRL